MISQAKLGIAVLSAIVMAGTCFAQAAAEAHKYYRLEFSVKELESGKATNIRSYSMMISTVDTGVIRTGNKVPVSTGTGPNSLTYLDIGVNIDCRGAKEIGDDLALNISAEVSSAATEQPTNQPLIRVTRWSSNVIVPMRKPTTVFSSDDPTTKRQTQLELTVVPIK